MELSDIFRIVNLAVAAITLLGGVAHIFQFTLAIIDRTCDQEQTSLTIRSRQGIVVAVYMIIFGLAIALLEFQIPPQVSRYASFLFSFLGRGVFYVFLGTLLLGDWVLNNIAGAIVGIVGVAYVVLEFVPAIEPPSNMREADVAGWGAEQV
ncbi:Golgi apparatus membrane protein TVP15 [Paramyrothecium foliicola]|nr:Golgi apparatus membrane protein TVP15 [Paramyrothecium foliicola]